MDRKKLVLGKCDQDDEYTIYKNTNEEMVNAIKAFALPEGIFSTHSHKNAKIVQVLNEKQNLCIDDKGENFVADNEYIDDCRKRNLIEKINKRFSVVEAIQYSLGDLYQENGLMVKINIHMELDYDALFRMSVSQHGIVFHNNEYRISLSENDDRWCKPMFCHLNKDGNIANRDHNINLTDYFKNKSVLKGEIVEKIIEAIPDVPYKNIGNKWFAEEFAFVLMENKVDDEPGDKPSEYKDIFRLERLPVKKNGNYGQKYGEKAKMPKRGITVVDKNHILRQILPFVNETRFGGEPVNLSKYINLEVE